MEKAFLKFLREQFPNGSRIRLREMKEPYDPVKPGAMGTLEGIDDAGYIHVQWDNGRTLSLVPGVDRFTVLPPEPTTLKLYMPLTANLYERNRYGDLEDDSTPLDGKELLSFEDQILTAMIKYRHPEESERGLMHYYQAQNGVNDKVRSAVFTAEVRDGQLWGVTECRVVGTLTPDELDDLKEYISGQASDGWGEGFEQWEIAMPDGGELYVHLWNSDGGWSIQTEQERFAPKMAYGLPEICFSVLPGVGRLICIKRGERGYFPSEWETEDPAKNRELADFNNGRLGVTKAQEEAMLTGSMMGWDCPGADPASYEESGQPQIGGMNHVV